MKPILTHANSVPAKEPARDSGIGVLAFLERRPLLITAVLLAILKAIQFALDSQALFFEDSGAFLMNAAGRAFITHRSYFYGDLIRVFAQPFHSLRAIVAMQVTIGALTAWLLAFALIRFLGVRAWIALLAALAFAMDPVQVVYERMVMTEASSGLAMALYLVAVFAYLRDRRTAWLIVLAFLGAVLVGFRMVYLPVVWATAIILPAADWFGKSSTPRRISVVAALVSLASTAIFQTGYQHLTGWLAHREPAYSDNSGYVLLANATPILIPEDASDPSVAAAIEAQRQSRVPLLPTLRPTHLWQPEGLVARLKILLGERESDLVAMQLARHAIRRNPLGFLRLGWLNYREYWARLPFLRWDLEWENGTQPPHLVQKASVDLIASVYGADVSNQETLRTRVRRYHIRARYWYAVLLFAPLFVCLAWAFRPPNPNALAFLLIWSCLMLAAMCIGAIESVYRYLHPFSFVVFASAAVLVEIVARARSRTNIAEEPQWRA